MTLWLYTKRVWKATLVVLLLVLALSLKQLWRETNNSALEFFNALYFLISWGLKRWLAWRYKCLWLNGAQNITWLSGSLYLTTGKNEFTSVLSFFWLGKKNQLPQDASVCVYIYRQMFVGSQSVCSFQIVRTHQSFLR